MRHDAVTRSCCSAGHQAFTRRVPRAMLERSNPGAGPLVSIITPTFNQANYLPDTIESVLAQDYRNIEYIVLDDGSADDTSQVLAHYSQRIHWESQTNRGQTATINKG